MASSVKMLTVNISTDCVHILEGHIHGDLAVKQLFTIENTSEFFAPAPAQEIMNLAGLVRTITTECKKHNVLCKRVTVCLPFSITTIFEQEEGHTSLSAAWKSFNSKPDKHNNGSDEKVKTKTGPDEMSSSVAWGTYPGDEVTMLSKSNTVANAYMLRAFAKEFYRYGYSLAGIVDVTGALLPFRQTDTAGFDAQGKVMIDFSDMTTVVTLYRDIPVSTEVLPKIETDNIRASVIELVGKQTRMTGKAPKVYISGTQLSNLVTYAEVLDALEADGNNVVDMYDAPRHSAEALAEEASDTKGDLTEAELTPDYGVNIGMLMIQPGKSTMLSPGVDFGSVLERYAKGIGTIGTGIAASILALAFAGAVLRCVNLVQIKMHPSNISSYQSQLTTLKQNQTSMNETINILSQTDSTVLDLLKFIKTNDTDRVRIVSMDTLEMLQVKDSGTVATAPNSFAVNGTSTGSTATTTPDSTQTAPTTEGTTGTSSPTPSNSDAVSSDGDSSSTTVTGGVDPTHGDMVSRQPIIMRGYAKTGSEAVDYFQKLFNSGLVTDPTLNGVERQTLPDGDEVYVFEIQIGGTAQ